MNTSRLRSALSTITWAAAAFLLGTWLQRTFMLPDAPATLPALTLNTLTGERVELAALRGQPVLVTFWATSCPMCVKEIPELVRLHETLAPRGLKLLAIAMPYDRPDAVLAMASRRNLPYAIALDPMGEAERAFGGIKATPTGFLYDGNGQRVRHWLGAADAERLGDEVAELLAGSGAKQQTALR
jgi:peroxiredoxin